MSVTFIAIKYYTSSSCVYIYFRRSKKTWEACRAACDENYPTDPIANSHCKFRCDDPSFQKGVDKSREKEAKRKEARERKAPLLDAQAAKEREQREQKARREDAERRENERRAAKKAAEKVAKAAEKAAKAAKKT